ncbi:MAG: 30S ribosomal protein S6, partial [Desulfuromusa sp.]|nr:30S ribosomal protein S6 [Desulfuromusa sp.]
GCYVQTLFSAEPEVIAEFERRLRLDEKIFRFLTVRFEEEFPAIVEAEPVVEEVAEATVEKTEEPVAEEKSVDEDSAPVEEEK